MSVDLATVRRLAGLARIATSDAEVDTSTVEPLAAVIPNHLRLRDDAVTDGGIRDAVLANAPQAEHGFFAVPKVIE